MADVGNPHEAAASTFMPPPAVVLPPLERCDYRVSVVLPVYSETHTVESIVSGLATRLGDMLHEVVIVLSPRSSDASREACERLAASERRVRLHVQQRNPGLGHAVREGYALTRGNLVLSMDSDGEMEIETVPRMVEEIGRGPFAMVVASRWIEGGGFSGYGRVKVLLNWAFQRVFRALLRTRLHDLTYGFKLMRSELARGIDWEGTLHEIACETTIKPVRLGFAVSEVPTRWTARRAGTSKNPCHRNLRYVSTALAILARPPAMPGPER